MKYGEEPCKIRHYVHVFVSRQESLV